MNLTVLSSTGGLRHWGSERVHQVFFGRKLREEKKSTKKRVFSPGNHHQQGRREESKTVVTYCMKKIPTGKESSVKKQHG